MPVETLPWSIQGQSHPATVARNHTAALLGAPAAAVAAGSAITTAGGSHGVVGPGDLVVTQNGTPNMSVNVAAGRAFIRGTQAAGSLNQGVYSFFNDGTVNLAVSSADPTNPRRDLVVAQIRDSNYSGAANDARLFVVTGTPAASPADPAVPADTLVLARISVAAGATSVVNANITDLRTRAAALGGEIICTSTTRPTGASLFDGLRIYETDTNRHWRHDGSNWVFMGGTGPRADIRRNTTINIASTTVTALQLNTTVVNTDSIWSAGSPTRLTVPTGFSGLYSINWSVQWGTNGVGAGVRQGFITVNGGATRFAQNFVTVPSSTTAAQISSSCILALLAGDYVELNLFQDSGAACSVYPNALANDGMFQLTWVAASG